ncbi:ALG3 protein [Dictyocaulus viviparus]|uniref:dolichyl-P-Man:Man5GlcNAc2-PP-dolichol alpha-1,3-mannosyltransferase n=1 Tax=Dictyocaulus viviparus TaxID=29172 RepID=A0A0D8Y780_DICVI|nr:ALG3 protein [Dictyocaulus viviparus]
MYEAFHIISINIYIVPRFDESLFKLGTKPYVYLKIFTICIAAHCGILMMEFTDTEIDWSTYMQQVECYTKQNIRNYSKIEGDTGPVVYPAGHLMIYNIFYSLTNEGKDIRTAQYIFMCLYLVNLLAVFRLYYKSGNIAPFVLTFLCFTGYRIHSIFVLRLFNDPVAMLLFYLAANFFVSQQWLVGCILYSVAVSIKMNVLLFAPAVFFILLLNIGIWRTVLNLVCCTVVQIYVGLPFLMYDPISYIRRSFDLSRVFLFEWTVNWRFLPEKVFLSSHLHLALLCCHLIALVIFGYYFWFRSHGGLRASLIELSYGIRTRTGVGETLYALFTANLIGITFARSLHYQFYSWYYHQLPFLLFWRSNEATALKQPVIVPWLSIIIK